MQTLDGKQMASSFSTGEKATPSKNGKLQVKEGKLCDESGKTVQLRGMSTHGLSWYPLYVNQAFFTQLANEWNCNVIRLAMYTAELDGYCEGGDQEGLRQIIREGVAYAKKADMYVIIDWHILLDFDPNTNKKDALAFFDSMSEEFKDENHVIYEICNEPNKGCDWKAVKEYANEVIPVIRSHAKDAVILVGTPTWSQDVDEALADPITGFDNLMYTFHFYAATHKDELRKKLKDAVDGGLPVFVSEYGLCAADGSGVIDKEESKKWISLLNENDISYLAWNISYKKETSAIFKPDRPKYQDLGWDDLTEYGKVVFSVLTKNSVETEEKE
ncbi:MAG: glycoside hydrolase family 5 protein [Lachnospiraceae bacterium]|nr:glycoside hydrolase family 5 protein [Lachnospiraceae bacterium]